MTQFPMGRTLEHDPRSWNYRHDVRSITAPLKSVTHTLAGPHLDQAKLGSCEGNTAAEFLNCAKALKNRILFNERDLGSDTDRMRARVYLDEQNAVQLYSKATTLDNDDIPGTYPPEDTGTSGVGIAKAMRAMGGLQTYNWTFTWEAFLATLQKQPVMLGINWYDDMFEVDESGFVNVGGKVAGGHAVLAYAYRPKTYGIHGVPARIGCTNHWVNDDGTPWGVKIGRHPGGFWIQDDALEQLLIHEQGDSLVPVLM